MALVSCKECGHQVSDKATTCPSCGGKLKPKTSGVTKFAAWGLALAVVIGVATYEPATAPVHTCKQLDPLLLKLPESHTEAQADFTAKAQRLRASGICVIEGNWGSNHQKFYFAIDKDGKPQNYYFIRLTREELRQ